MLGVIIGIGALRHPSKILLKMRIASALLAVHNAVTTTPHAIRVSLHALALGWAFTTNVFMFIQHPRPTEFPLSTCILTLSHHICYSTIHHEGVASDV